MEFKDMSIPKNLDNMTRDSNNLPVTGEMPDQVFTYGIPQRLNPNQFKKEHYDFANWIGSDENIYENEKEMSSYTGDDLELFAVWTPSKYHVHFDGNGETSGTMEDQEFIYGVSQRLNKNNFINDNFNFIGWLDPETGKQFSDEDEIELSSDLNLVAKWSQITSTLTFYRNPEQEEQAQASPPLEETQDFSTNSTQSQQSQSQLTILFL